MLGLDVNVDIDIKKVKYPIYFEGQNKCVHCGGQGTLTFVDKFGKETNKEINAFDHIICTKCNRLYSIQWDRVDNAKMRATAVNPSIALDLKNMFNIGNIRSDGDMNLN